MRQAVAFFALFTTLLLASQSVGGSDYLDYNIHIIKDGSALWTITQVTDIDSSVDSWEEFEERVFTTVNDAIDCTGREMAVDLASLEMKTEIYWETSSKKIEYRFRWENFSVVEERQISFGDVFSDEFFSLLYGDGELYITYPAEYDLKSVSLAPNQRENSTQTLHWYRTQDFLVGDPNFLLASRDAVSNEDFPLFTVAVLGSVAFGAVTISFLILKQRIKRKEKLPKSDEFSSWQEIENDQERILQLLRSSGGNLKQSEVCQKLRFSRAKTSLLLTEMEKNSLVRRRKKGKNKIVFLMETKEGQNL